MQAYKIRLLERIEGVTVFDSCRTHFFSKILGKKSPCILHGADKVRDLIVAACFF